MWHITDCIRQEEEAQDIQPKVVIVFLCDLLEPATVVIPKIELHLNVQSRFNAAVQDLAKTHPTPAPVMTTGMPKTDHSSLFLRKQKMFF